MEGSGSVKINYRYGCRSRRSKIIRIRILKTVYQLILTWNRQKITYFLTHLLRFQERRLPIFLMLGQAARIRSMLVAVRFRIPGSEFRPGTTIITLDGRENFVCFFRGILRKLRLTFGRNVPVLWIRIQHLNLYVNADPGFWWQKILQLKKPCFLIKLQFIYPRLPWRTSKLQKTPSALKREHLAIQKIFSVFVVHFCPPGFRSSRQKVP